MADYFYLKDQNLYVEVKECEDSESPREYGSNFGHFITFEDKYNSPDENEFDTSDDMMEFFKVPSNDGYYKELRYMEKNELQDLVKRAEKQGYILVPVFKYEHGSVIRRAEPNCKNPFISINNVCGVIYVSKKKIREAYHIKKLSKEDIETAKQSMVAEVNTYDKWTRSEGIYDVYVYNDKGIQVDGMSQYWVDTFDSKDVVKDCWDWIDFDEDEIVELPKASSAKEAIAKNKETMTI